MKILVIKFMHIGDVLLITPLLKNLKYYFPDAEIDVALNKGTEEMITENPNVGKIHTYDRVKIKSLSLFPRLTAEFDFAMEIRREEYDMVINLTSGDRGLLTAIFSGAKECVSFLSSKNTFLNRFVTRSLSRLQLRHWVDINLDALRVLDKEPMEKKVEIFWQEDLDNSIDELLEKNTLKEKQFIHFHPVSRWLFRCIDDKIAAEIIDFCQETLHLPVVITAAPIAEEKQKVNDILKLCQTTPLDLTGKLSLKETAAINKRSLMYVGVDTAIMHISAANDVPVLAFFGPSIPYAWGPWDNSFMENQYISYRGDQSMGKHTILQKQWECVPCDAKGCHDSGISDCLMQMDIEAIKAYIVKNVKVNYEE